MQPDPAIAASRHRTLWVLRVIWAMLIFGQLGFGTVALVSANQAGGDGQTQLRFQMFAIALGLLIGAVGLGYFVRNQFYKRFWREHAIAPQGYFLGNLLLFVLLEVVSMLSFVFVLISASIFPVVLPAAASLAVQCVNFPTGLPMASASPDLGAPPDLEAGPS